MSSPKFFATEAVPRGVSRCSSNTSEPARALLAAVVVAASRGRRAHQRRTEAVAASPANGAQPSDAPSFQQQTLGPFAVVLDSLRIAADISGLRSRSLLTVSS